MFIQDFIDTLGFVNGLKAYFLTLITLRRCGGGESATRDGVHPPCHLLIYIHFFLICSFFIIILFNFLLFLVFELNFINVRFNFF